MQTTKHAICEFAIAAVIEEKEDLERKALSTLYDIVVSDFDGMSACPLYCTGVPEGWRLEEQESCKHLLLPIFEKDQRIDTAPICFIDAGGGWLAYQLQNRTNLDLSPYQLVRIFEIINSAFWSEYAINEQEHIGSNTLDYSELVGKVSKDVLRFIQGKG